MLKLKIRFFIHANIFQTFFLGFSFFTLSKELIEWKWKIIVMSFLNRFSHFIILCVFSECKYKSIIFPQKKGNSHQHNNNNKEQNMIKMKGNIITMNVTVKNYDNTQQTAYRM